MKKLKERDFSIEFKYKLTVFDKNDKNMIDYDHKGICVGLKEYTAVFCLVFCLFGN
jgi:hypothetical protein